MTSPTKRCKCCSAAAIPFAKLDFSRTCEDRHAPPFAPSGEMVPYFHCQSCGFIFTDHFDAWSPGDMAERIYNADYHLADPEFTETRPASRPPISFDGWAASGRTSRRWITVEARARWPG